MSVMLINYNEAGNLIKGITELNQMWDCDFLNVDTFGQPNEVSTKLFILKLFRANLATFNRKYMEDQTMPDIIKITGEPMTPHQVVKKLQALHYNIELEYAPEMHNELKRVQTLINSLIHWIVMGSEEYKAASWS